MVWKSLRNHPWFGSRSLFLDPSWLSLKWKWLHRRTVFSPLHARYVWHPLSTSVCQLHSSLLCASPESFDTKKLNFWGLTTACAVLCVSRVEVVGGYHEYTDVKSCQDVVHLYHLLWSATILNIVALFLGIITAAVLGGFKDMVGRTEIWGFRDRAWDETRIMWFSLCVKTPAQTSESNSEPEAITASVASEATPRTNSNVNSYRDAAPCLPPYTAYDAQVM